MRSVTLAGAIGLCLTSALVGQEQEVAAVSVIDFVSSVYMEGLPVEVALGFDPEDAMTLMPLLANDEQRRYWTNAVITVGAAGDTRMVDSLVSFLERGEGIIDELERQAKTAVPLGLALLAQRTESPRAMQYLLSSVFPRAWADRGLSWSTGEPAVLYQDLAEHSILSLGVTGVEGARVVLEQLAGGVEGTRLAEVAEQALEIWAVVSTSGVEGYYAPPD